MIAAAGSVDIVIAFTAMNSVVTAGTAHVIGILSSCDIDTAAI